MIKDFLILSCIGKNDKIGLKVSDKFYVHNFDKKIEELESKNKWKKVEFFKSDYIASKDVNAWLGLYEVKKIK